MLHKLNEHLLQLNPLFTHSACKIYSLPCSFVFFYNPEFFSPPHTLAVLGSLYSAYTQSPGVPSAWRVIRSATAPFPCRGCRFYFMHLTPPYCPVPPPFCVIWAGSGWSSLPSSKFVCLGLHTIDRCTHFGMELQSDCVYFVIYI